MFKRIALVIVLLNMSIILKAEKDQIPRHCAVFQLGGQSVISLHHEYCFSCKDQFSLYSNFGFGLNENADDTDLNDRATYAFYHGIHALLSKNNFGLEIGLDPTSYVKKSIGFIDLNIWLGLRYSSKQEGFYVGLGYTPIVYSTFSNNNNTYAKIEGALKFGISF